jgi:lactoylglutathione lyase
MKHLILLALITPLTLHAADVAKRPRILGISNISFFVHDIEKSRIFYREFLGFSLSKEAARTLIHINDRQTVELLPEKEADTDRLSQISLKVDDAEAMHRYLAAHRVNASDTTTSEKNGAVKFSLRDPDDHFIEIMQSAPDSRSLPDTRISTRISHVGILVGDLAAALTFYRGILGGSETWRGGANPKVLSWVNVKVPEGEDYLEFILYQTLPAPSKRGGKHHFCLEVPDIKKTGATLLERAARIGYTQAIEIKTGINRRRQINLFDPDGTRVEVMEPNTVDGVPVPSSTAPPPVAKTK